MALPELIDVEDLFGPPERSGATISPDGSRIAFLAPWKNRRRIDEIRTPLLVVQGANDVRVVQAESDRIVGGLCARGVVTEYFVFPDEGHDFVNPENRIGTFSAAERFLAQHLGGRNDHG